MPTLKSNALLGGPENLWLLRRNAANTQDRERLVQAFDPAAGRVIVDRNWYTPMAPSEAAEFTHLHPTQELRQSVMAGLRRWLLEAVREGEPNVEYGTIAGAEQEPGGPD